MLKKKKVVSQEDNDTKLEHITALLDQIQRERKAYVDAFTIARKDYVKEGGSKMYFPMYLKETYGIDLRGWVEVNILSYLPDFTIVDQAKFEFFALRYL